MKARPEVIAKLAKLKRLAERAATPGEAAAAAAAMQRLLTEHQLTEEDIESETVAKHEIALFRGKPPSWKLSIFAFLGEQNSCHPMVVITGVESCSAIVVGRKTNADAVKYLYDYIVPECEKLADEYCERGQPFRFQFDATSSFAGATLSFGGADRRSFLLGCIRAIAKSIEDAVIQTKDAATQGRYELSEATGDASKALVRIDNAGVENKSFIERHYGKPKEVDVSDAEPVDRISYQSGLIAGSRVYGKRKEIES